VTARAGDRNDGREGRRAWGVSSGLSVFYLLVGIAHVAGNPVIVQHFAAWGYPDAFRVLVGVLEIMGAVGLLSSRLGSIAATLLGLVMAGAVYTHVFRGEPIFALVPAGLLALLVVVGKNRLDTPLTWQSPREVPPGGDQGRLGRA
jgi:putative oxidoreductase